MEEIRGRIIIDTRYESYQSFYDHDWARSIDKLVTGTPLDKPIFNLCISWKSVMNTFRMPWLLVHCLQGMHDSFYFHSEIREYLPKLGKMIGDRIIKEVPTLTVTKGQEVQRAVASITSSMTARIDGSEKSIKNQRPPFNVEEAWTGFLQVPEFQMGIWGNQRTCFSALYFAYENFIGDVVSHFRNDDDYELEGPTMFTHLREALDQATADTCLDFDVLLAKMVRHALAHNGGHMTKKLRYTKEKMEQQNKLFPFRLEDDDEIHIMPLDVHWCFRLLKSKVQILTEAALKKA